MARLNVTLDRSMYAELEKRAKQLGKPRARIVKEILLEGLARWATAARRKKLAADYVAGRADARAVLKDLESSQWELLDGDES